jgi:hypothetical protein
MTRVLACSLRLDWLNMPPLKPETQDKTGCYGGTQEEGL